MNEQKDLSNTDFLPLVPFSVFLRGATPHSPVLFLHYNCIPSILEFVYFSICRILELQKLLPPNASS